MSGHQKSTSMAASPSEADPMTLKSPINKDLIPSLSDVLNEKDKVFAGFIPESDPNSDILQHLILHLDNAQDAKLQKVWDDYLADPEQDINIDAMTLYNAKDFKPRLVILAGYPAAIEKAKTAGLKTHPDLVVIPPPEKEVTDDAAAKPEDLPTQGIDIPGTATAASEKKRSSRNTKRKQASEEADEASPTKLDPQDPAVPGPSSLDSTVYVEEQSASATQGTEIDAALSVLKRLLPPEQYQSVETIISTPMFPAPADAHPDETGPDTRQGRFGYVPKDKPGKLRFGSSSVDVDAATYKDLTSLMNTRCSNTNDGWEHLINKLAPTTYATQDLDVDYHYNQQSAYVRLSQVLTPYKDGTIALNANTHSDRFYITGPHHYDIPLAVSGETPTYEDTVKYPPQYYFMASFDLTSAVRRQAQMMNNIYRCHGADDFIEIHNAIKGKVQRHNTTLAYCKGWLYYLSMMQADSTVAALYTQRPVLAVNLNGAPQATTIYYDAPNVQQPPATRAWLNASVQGTGVPYYARSGCTEAQIIVDAAMYAQYPVWEFEIQLDHRRRRNRRNRTSPLANLVRFVNDRLPGHHTYTMEQSVYNYGVAAAVGAPTSNLIFPANPPTAEEWFKSLYNIAAENRELDAWRDGLTLAINLIVERCRIMGQQREYGALNPLLDYDVINIGFARPLHRAAQAFNAQTEAGPVPPNARAIIQSPLTRQYNVYFFAALMYGYARSCVLSRFNFAGGELIHVPMRFRNGLNPISMTRIVQSFPSVENANSQDAITPLAQQMFTGLFGFTLPNDFEKVIHRYMSRPDHLQANKMQMDVHQVPFVARAIHLLRMIVKLPVESGIWTRDTTASIRKCLFQVNTAHSIDTIYPSQELSSRWDSIMYLQTPILLTSFLLRYIFAGRAADITITTQQITIQRSMDDIPMMINAPFDPFVTVPIAPNPANQVPILEFEAVTADFSGPVATTNYMCVTLNVPRMAAVQARLHAVSKDAHCVPIYGTWEWIDMQVMPSQAAGYITMPNFSIASLPPPAADTMDSAPTRAPAAPPAAPPAGTTPVTDQEDANRRGTTN